jgi:hypothetical protein
MQKKIQEERTTLKNQRMPFLVQIVAMQGCLTEYALLAAFTMAVMY